MFILTEEEIVYLRGLTYFVEPEHLKVLTAILAYGDRILLNNVPAHIIIQLREILVNIDSTVANNICLKVLDYLEWLLND